MGKRTNDRNPKWNEENRINTIKKLINYEFFVNKYIKLPIYFQS